MTTSSLKLPDDVKQLAVAGAERQGVWLHAFMVEAIRAAGLAAEQRAAFVADAEAVRDEAVASGKAYAAADAHAYLQARVRGQLAPRPRAKAWRG